MASNDTSILDNLEIDVQHDISFYFFIFRNRIQTFQAVFSMKGTAYLIHYVTGVQIKLDLFVKKFFYTGLLRIISGSDKLHKKA